MSRERMDWPLACSIFCLSGLGLLFLFSASHHLAVSSGHSYVARQSVWLLCGLAMLLVMLRFPVTRWFDLSGMLYILNLVFLLLVLVLGQSHFGAQRWFPLGPISFQPSEFSKIVVVLALARYLGLRSPHSEVPKTLATTFLIVGIPMALILMQPDLGTALVLVPVLYALLWAWGLSWRWWFGLLSAQLALSPLFRFILKGYQKQRLLVFLDPNQDPLGAGYSIIQSKIAIGSGGLFGKGWLAGTQNQLNFLPEHHTDFIFSVVGEEWGFLGALVTLFLYWVVIWRAMTIASAQKLVMARLLAVGIATLMSVHVVVNMGMTIGLMPVVGLPLPLASYGGSSLIMTFFSLSLLLALRWQKGGL